MFYSSKRAQAVRQKPLTAEAQVQSRGRSTETEWIGTYPTNYSYQKDKRAKPNNLHIKENNWRALYIKIISHNLYSCTVNLDIIRVFLFSPTDALYICFGVH
jgi:cellulase/cellobiase CelA1